MQQLDVVRYWRNRQAELEIHISRHQWFVNKGVLEDPRVLQRIIDAYCNEWNGYERLVRKVMTSHQNSVRSAA